MKTLHDKHFSLTAMMANSRKSIYWTGLNRSLENIWNSCQNFQSLRRALKPQTLIEERTYRQLINNLSRVLDKAYLQFFDMRAIRTSHRI